MQVISWDSFAVLLYSESSEEDDPDDPSPVESGNENATQNAAPSTGAGKGTTAASEDDDEGGINFLSVCGVKWLSHRTRVLQSFTVSFHLSTMGHIYVTFLTKCKSFLKIENIRYIPRACLSVAI